MIQRKTRLKPFSSLWYSTPLEQFKGILFGYSIKIRNPARYQELKALRGGYLPLLKKKRELIRVFIAHLKTKEISFQRVTGRVKTFGSLDRKEKISRKKYSEKGAREYVISDLIGIKIITHTERDYYRIISSLKELGEFCKTSFAENPRYYIRNEDTKEPEIRFISGNFKFKREANLIHLIIISNQADKIRRQSYRGPYKKKMKELI